MAALLVGLLTASVFGQVGDFGFVTFDDQDYLYENPWVRDGLTPGGLRWALTSLEYSNWHPLTWISLMLQVSLLGPGPGPAHLVNLALHLGTAILLLAFLGQATGRLWPAAMVAALFAVHPQHVESVAWVAQRKDVLAGLLFLLALLAWLGYLRRPSPGRYLTVALLHLAGLAAKPTVVTFPLVLLLLDRWPLGRGRGPAGRGFPALAGEKVPLLLLSAAGGALTWVAQSRGGALKLTYTTPLLERLGVALVSLAGYLRRTVWPVDLAVLYPYPEGGVPVAAAVGALALLAAVSWLAWRWRHLGFPATGWLWFLVMVLPVSGLAQVGSQAGADRYTYLPLAGIFLWLAWGMDSLRRCRSRTGPHLATAAVLVLLVLAGAARVQAGYWRESAVLYRRALQVTRGNWVMHVNLGGALAAEGRWEEAAGEYRRALAVREDERARFNLGNAYLALGRPAEAEAEYRTAIAQRPDARFLHHLGKALLRQERYGEAEAALRQALSAGGGRGEVSHDLGLALQRQGRLRESAEAYRTALAAAPQRPETHNNLGAVLHDLGRHREAEDHYREARRLRPGYLSPTVNLADLLAGRGEREAAAALYREVLRQDPANRRAREGLALVGG
jgi:tetratricopeptide (TPR) repeat protein